jgi:hypothetical protein
MEENFLKTKVTAGIDLSYVEVLGSDHLLSTYDDAVDLVSLCMGNPGQQKPEGFRAA